MAYDFPLAPTVGLVYEDPTSGAAYIWNGWAWDLVAGGDLTDYVLKAGDTMTGGLSFGSAVAPSVGDNSRHIMLWENTADPTKGFGFNITSGHLNYNVDAPANVHAFRCGGASVMTMTAGAVNVPTTNLNVETGYVIAKGLYCEPGTNNRHVTARAGSNFLFQTTDNNAWKTAFSCGQAYIQYIQGGNNDGRFRLYTENGGYSGNWILETTVVNGNPGINVNGTVRTGSGDNYGIFMGDHWHGWAWSNTGNCEHLRSYQGKFIFLKTANTDPGAGEALYTIDTAGGTVNMAMSAQSFVDRSLIDRPELAEFLEGDDDVQEGFVVPTRRRGVNLGKLLLRALARIEALECEVKTLRDRK